jgi:hypothetical protein
MSKEAAAALMQNEALVALLEEEAGLDDHSQVAP